MNFLYGHELSRLESSDWLWNQLITRVFACICKLLRVHLQRLTNLGTYRIRFGFLQVNVGCAKNVVVWSRQVIPKHWTWNNDVGLFILMIRWCGTLRRNPFVVFLRTAGNMILFIRLVCFMYLYDQRFTHKYYEEMINNNFFGGKCVDRHPRIFYK